MKRNKLIVVAVVSACLLAVLLGVFNLCRYYFPMPGPTSDLFERYKDNPHIRATYLRNFQVNDTLRVDVTLLQATDSVGWHCLMLDFGYTEEMIEAYNESVKRMKNRPIHQFVRFTVDKNDYSKRLPPDDVNSRQVIGSYKNQTFSVYHTDKFEIKDIIAKKELKNLNPKNDESKF